MTLPALPRALADWVRLQCSLIFWLWALSVGCPSLLVAQELRATQIADEQSTKADSAKPYEPGRAERVFTRIKNSLLSSPSGLYPLFGSVVSGGGLALGAGVRHYYGDNTFWNAKSLYSIQNYKWLELSTDSLGLAGGTLDLHARAGWRDAPQMPFYGLGTKASEDDRSNFRLQRTYVGGDAVVFPSSLLILDFGVAYEVLDSGQGSGAFPSIEERFSPSDAPGLGADPTFIHSRAQVGLDWRPADDYARKGGRYAVQFQDYRDRDADHSFSRLDGDIVQHVPLMRENIVLSLHGRLETILDPNDDAPHFMLPSLGSGSTLRAFSSWRFRDRHALLLQAEWRWTPNRTGLDLAFFYDAGKVTHRREDLDLRGLKSDVGIGVRLHGPAVTPLRLELAHGNEGFRVVLGGSAAF